MQTYSPDRRTAVVLCGTGAHGAYHAGALRAFHEAGVKIDVMAGRGVGAAGAALAAIDGGARLWEPGGLWRDAAVSRFYGWTWPIRTITWVGLIVVVILITPLLYVALGVSVYVIGFVLEMLGNAGGSRLIAAYSGWLQDAFAGPNLPTIVPRIATLTFAALVLSLLAFVALQHWHTPVRRRAEGHWWWRVLGAPLDGSAATQLFARTIWHLIRGASSAKQPSTAALGRRYADVLAENFGQPGFRQLLIVATDLDARRDVVAALLEHPCRSEFVAPQPGRERGAEALDLAGAGRDYTFDLIAAALTPPLACEPHTLTFAADSYWRGETHRLCDRPASLIRILEELCGIGVTQAIIVSAVAPMPRPHGLGSFGVDTRSRLAEFVTVSEAAALRDAVAAASTRFDALYVICPPHNPVGPFDVAGAYDEASDRRQGVLELLEQGYQDAYRQFVEPVVGASGEHLARHAAGAAGSSGGMHVDRIFDAPDSSR